MTYDPMTCAEFEDLILDEIDGRVASEAIPLIRAHTAACESCRSFLAAQIELDRSLAAEARGEARPELSPRFTSEVLARAAHVRPRSAPGIGFVFAWDLAGLAGVAAAGAFGVLHLFANVPAGGAWVVAGSILCGGAFLVLGDPDAPHI